MEQGNKVNERISRDANDGIEESGARCEGKVQRVGSSTPEAVPSETIRTSPGERTCPECPPQGLGNSEPHHSSMFTENVTETGSFQVRWDWLEPLWNILQALPVGVLVVDRSHHIAFANQVCLEVLNADRSLEGKAFASLFSEFGEALKADRIAEEVSTATTPRTTEAQVFSGNKKIWARLHYRPLRIVDDRCVLILVEDLTADRDKLELIEKHRSELIKARAELDTSNAQLLQEAEERRKAQAIIERAKREWERTFDAVPDLISIVDKNHRMIRVNRALADRLGKSYDEILGAECIWSGPGADPLHDCPHVQLMLDGKPHHAELTDERLGGVFDVAVSPLHDEEGQLIGSVHVARDITDVKKALQLLLESGRARVVAELAAMVAHSFNNLLQTAMGGTQLCLTNLELGNYSDVKNTLEGLLEELRSGARTVRRLTFLARVCGPPSLHEDRILDLSATVHQALDMCSPWWKNLPEQAGIRITLKRDLGPDCIVKGDQDQLLELVVDLVRNAAEALPEGGTIDVRTRREGDRVALTVKDNGVGIPDEDVSKVFQPLWSTKGPSSAGMGLERVNSTVKRHGGKCFLTSRPGIGTAVSVVLPALPVQEDEIEIADHPEPGPARRILLVDDLEPVVKVLAKGLGQVGHKVFPCMSGPRAVELFKSSPFDLVICDLGMPDMNGWQVAKKLQELAKEMNRPKTPFILTTGWGVQPHQEEMMAKFGVDSILEKPIDINELTRIIRRVVAQV